MPQEDVHADASRQADTALHSQERDVSSCAEIARQRPHA
jgi:hypothetical protein